AAGLQRDDFAGLQLAVAGRIDLDHGLALTAGQGDLGALEGAIRHVRSFGPIQRAEVALAGSEGKTVIEIDAPRDRELQAGEIVSLQPRRYRIFAAQ
ncbi:TOBE-like domain-containing protein, partial [Bradyrhizobium sp.]|uniref:TOBE-like domain-containing protein n=1 Tax=Bradyrhizobium sp. TaxID=376 RepID=UPI0039199560